MNELNVALEDDKGAEQTIGTGKPSDKPAWETPKLEDVSEPSWRNRTYASPDPPVIE